MLWLVLIPLALISAALLIGYICFRMAFYNPPRRDTESLEAVLPPGETYAPYREQMRDLTIETRSFPFEPAQIESFEGLKLYGKYYEYDPAAPMEIMFPGYRGLAERDLCGGVQRAFAVGHNVLLVDQRACGKCDGNVITFGIYERLDCLKWIDYAISRFGPDIKIVLSGVSMGSATVTMAAGMELPENVIGVVADSGYTSPKDIICKVIRQLKLPVSIVYPMLKLSARLFGRFDLEELSPIEAMKDCTIPVVFIHGESDDFVPCEMSRQNYDACTAPKAIFTVPGAGHGLSYIIDPEGYLNTLNEFAPKWGL